MKRTSVTSLFLLLLIMITLLSCNKSRSIDIDLPEYKKQLVVECYLEPGKPYRLLLTESVSYFDVPSIPQVQDAVVTITFKGQTDTLKHVYITLGNPDSTKLFNFYLDKIVPEVYNEPFRLHITDGKGRRITAETMLLPPVKADTIRYVFEEMDSTGYAITEIDTKIAGNDYFRFLLLDQQAGSTTLAQDIYFDANLTTTSPYLIKHNGVILIKSKNRISRFPTVSGRQFINLYHVEEAYYKYLKSVSDSKTANGNPFAQPPGLKTNVEGGLGIFTGLSLTQLHLEPPKSVQLNVTEPK